MRRLALAAAVWLALAAPALATAISSNGTGGGTWASTGTWAGGVVPGTGDTVTLANGDTVTVPIATSVTVGSSPTDDTGTPAIQCVSSTGTAALVVNGTLIYRGPVRLCTATTVGPGATLTHDSSLAATPSAAHYSWQQATTTGRTTSRLNLNGSSGSRITINIAGGSGFSGGFITPGATGTQDGGQLVGAFFDVTGGCGQAGSSSTLCMSAYLFSSGDTFSVDHATFSGNNGHWAFAQMNGAAVWSITNTAYQTASPLTNTTSATKCFEFGIGSSNFLTNPKTSGTRLVSNNFFDGCVVTLQGATSGFATLDQGIVYDHNWMSDVSTSIGPLTNIGGTPRFTAGNWHDNLIWTTAPSPVHPAWGSPAGTLQRTYSLSDDYAAGVTGAPLCDGSSNYHVNQMNTEVTYDGWVFEPWDDGSSKIQGGGGIGAGGANFPVAFQNVIELPAGCPARASSGGFGSAYLFVDALACTQSGSSWCPLVTFKQNTVIAKASGGAGCGNGSERSDYVAGVAYNQGNFNNLYWMPASDVGCIENYTGSPPAGTFVNTQDYNWRFNLTGATSTIYHNFASGAYASAPGAHDQSGNPAFKDSTRNFLKWCKTLNGADASWLDCKAHFADIGTAAHNAAYNISDLIDYVRAGFAPTNLTLNTAGNTGGFVGAVAPVPPASSAGPGRMMLR